MDLVYHTFMIEHIERTKNCEMKFFVLLPVPELWLHNPFWSAKRVVGSGHCRLPACLLVCLFVNSITEKLLDGFRRNLVWGLGMVQGSWHSILDLVQSPIWPLWRPFWKNIWIFVFAFLHVLSDFQPKKKKLLEKKKTENFATLKKIF